MPTATLSHLISVRSQVALGLEAYLQMFADLSRWPTPPFLGGRAVLDVYLQPDVLLSERLPNGSPIADDEERLTPGRADERRPWVRERRRLLREARRLVVVLGRPGDGKTLLSQMACRTVARASLRAWKAQRAPLDQIPVPVWIDAKDVETAGGSIAVAVETEMVRLASLDARITPALDHLLTHWTRDSSMLFIDSLDEPERLDPRAVIGSVSALLCRTLVTSRPYAFDPVRRDFPAAHVYELAPLTREQQNRFIAERWFTADAAGAARVRTLLDANPQVRDLSTIGLLLTLVCTTAETHPDTDLAGLRRAQLYDLVLRDLVGRVHMPSPAPMGLDSLDDARVDRVSVEDRLLAIREAAWTIERGPQPQAGTAPSPPFRTAFGHGEWRRALVEACRTYGLDPDLVGPLTRQVTRSGLLVPARTGQWRFLHRTFLEASTAAGLAQQPGVDVIVEALSRQVDADGWRQVALFTVGHLSIVLGEPERTGEVVNAVLAATPGKEPGNAAVLMGKALVEALPIPVTDAGWKATVGAALDRTSVEKALLTTMQDRVMRDGTPAPVIATTRAAAGTALGRIGDPRFRPDIWWLPDDVVDGFATANADALLGFVEVPGGPFQMGSDKRIDPLAVDDETVAGRTHTVTLPTFCIARYPVTVAQFQAFCEDTHENGGFRPSDRRCLDGAANHPVVWVSWREAVRYCEWLTNRLRERVRAERTSPDWRRRSVPHALATRLFEGEGTGGPWAVLLPSEAEWEKAARGHSPQMFPWGNYVGWHEDLEGMPAAEAKALVNRANFWWSETALIATNAVGCFPSGASPFGVQELAGNVWEWTRSEPLPYPYVPGHDRESMDVSSTSDRVLRGGSFANLGWCMRCACRHEHVPDSPYRHCGFRIVVAPFSL